MILVWNALTCIDLELEDKVGFGDRLLPAGHLQATACNCIKLLRKCATWWLLRPSNTISNPSWCVVHESRPHSQTPTFHNRQTMIRSRRFSKQCLPLFDIEKQPELEEAEKEEESNSSDTSNNDRWVSAVSRAPSPLRAPQRFQSQAQTTASKSAPNKLTSICWGERRVRENPPQVSVYVS